VANEVSEIVVADKANVIDVIVEANKADSMLLDEANVANKADESNKAYDANMANRAN
jgi:hypothetical protein